jgi:hypothetical protein
MPAVKAATVVTTSQGADRCGTSTPPCRAVRHKCMMVTADCRSVHQGCSDLSVWPDHSQQPNKWRTGATTPVKVPTCTAPFRLPSLIIGHNHNASHISAPPIAYRPAAASPPSVAATHTHHADLQGVITRRSAWATAPRPPCCQDVPLCWQLRPPTHLDGEPPSRCMHLSAAKPNRWKSSTDTAMCRTRNYSTMKCCESASAGHHICEHSQHFP